MANSLLQISQNVAEATGFVAPSNIVGGNDRAAKTLLRLANTEGRSLARHDWVCLQRELIVSASATSEYALPSDFRSLIPATDWDRSQQWRMAGPYTPQEWQEEQSGLVTAYIRPEWRVKINVAVGPNKRLFFTTAPTSAAGSASIYVFEYLSDNWVYASASGEFRNIFEKDTDYPVFDDFVFELGLKWRWLEFLGRDYREAKYEYEKELGTAKARDGGMRVRSLNERRLDFAVHIPDTGFGS